MFIYFFTFSLALGLYYIGFKNKIPAIKFFSIGILVLFAGLRYLVGQDFKSYWWIYQSIESSVAEPGYVFLCKFLTFFGFGAQIHFLLLAGLTFFFIIKSLNLYDKKHIIFCIFLYLFAGFYIDSLNIVRQALAIAIFFYAGKFVEQAKLYRYVLWVIIASCFHLSAILLIPFYYVLNRQYSRYVILFAIIISVGISYTGIIGKFMGMLPIYTNYLESGNVYNVNSNLGFGALCKYLIGFILILNKDRLASYSQYINIAINSYSIYLILMGMMQEYLVFLRFSYYFQIFLIIALPALISIIKNNGSRTISRLLIICYCFIVLFTQTNDIRSNLVPYQINYNFYQVNLEK